MKKIILLPLILFTLSFVSKAQTCDSIVHITESYLKADNQLFVSDGQVYKAFLDESQTAEFSTTLYGGTTYRVAASAGNKDNYIIFNVYDKNRNLIFTNVDYKNAPYWDFKVENTLDCSIEAKLDLDKKVSGCAVLLIGFKR